MKIFVGADHRGYNLKKKIVKFLNEKGYQAIDSGAHTNKTASDYPKISYKVAREVVLNKNARGILICMTGLGNSIAANKIRGIRGTLCYNKKAAYFSRAHNDSNVLIIGSRFVNHKEIFGIIDTWLKVPFEGGRHLRRVNQIKAIEKKYCKKIK